MSKDLATFYELLRAAGVVKNNILPDPKAEGSLSVTIDDATALAVMALLQLQNLRDRLERHEHRSGSAWIDLDEGSRLSGMSRRSLFRHIESGALTSKLAHGQRWIERSSLVRFTDFQ